MFLKLKWAQMSPGWLYSWSLSTQEYLGLNQKEWENQKKEQFRREGLRDDGFCKKHAELIGTMAEYPGGQI